jgi:hypothetical protein
VTTGYGIYCAPVLTGTVTTAYGGYFVTPSGTATNKVAVYADSIKIGAAVSGSQTTGTIVATSTGTFDNINLSGFTFRNSLACATYDASGTWKGITTPVSAHVYFMRFGYQITIRIPSWQYNSTQTGVIPYFDVNPTDYAPTANFVSVNVLNHANTWINGVIFINTNATIYMYSSYAVALNTTNTIYSFPGPAFVNFMIY